MCVCELFRQDRSLILAFFFITDMVAFYQEQQKGDLELSFLCITYMHPTSTAVDWAWSADSSAPILSHLRETACFQHALLFRFIEFVSSQLSWSTLQRRGGDKDIIQENELVSLEFKPQQRMHRLKEKSRNATT